MSDLAITARDVEALVRLAGVLIPGTSAMPAASELAGFDAPLRTAIKACGYANEEMRVALDRIPANAGWESARAFAAEDPKSFEIVSVLVSAAYYMSPLVLERLNYPVERQHPAGHDEFAEEYATGLLDPVTARGPRFRGAGRPAG